MSSVQRMRARAAALERGPGLSGLGRVLPSGRSLLIGFALLVSVLGAYAAARATSLFAVQEVEVHGAPPRVARRVEAALERLAGQSLLSVNARDVDRALAPLPDVQALGLDRAFPRTLTVTVTAERPVAVLRRGSEAWLISERGRVLRTLPRRPATTSLPRIWVARLATPGDGVVLAEEEALRPALALGGVLAADRRFLGRIRTARAVGAEVTLVLRAGTELRLGSTDDLLVKVMVAKQILSALPGASGGYVDVSVPERAVARVESQLSG